MQDQTLSDRLRAAARDRDFAGADPHGDAALMRKAAAELERLSARGPGYWLIDEDDGDAGETLRAAALLSNRRDRRCNADPGARCFVGARRPVD
jgi:hypothetical protein